MDREGLKARGRLLAGGAPFGEGRRRGGAPRGGENAAGGVGGVHADGHAEAQLRQPARPGSPRGASPRATISTRSHRTTRCTSACPGAGGCTGPSCASPTPGPWSSPASDRDTQGAVQRRESCARATASPPGSFWTDPTRRSSSTRCFVASRASPTRIGWREAGSARGVRGGGHHQHLRGARPHARDPRCLPARPRRRRTSGARTPPAERARCVGGRPPPRPGGRRMGPAPRPRRERRRHAAVRGDLRRRREREDRRDHRRGLPLRGVGGSTSTIRSPTSAS